MFDSDYFGFSATGPVGGILSNTWTATSRVLLVSTSWLYSTVQTAVVGGMMLGLGSLSIPIIAVSGISTGVVAAVGITTSVISTSARTGFAIGRGILSYASSSAIAIPSLVTSSMGTAMSYIPKK